MGYRKITAIIRPEVLDEVEARLEAGGVRGFTVTPVKGTGEYANSRGGDPKVDHVRLEILTTAEREEKVVAIVLAGAHTGDPGDGIIAVSPVDRVLRIRSQDLALGSEL